MDDINDPPEMLPHQRVSFTFLNNLILDGRTLFEAYTVPVGKHVSRCEEVSPSPSRTTLHHGKGANVGSLNMFPLEGAGLVTTKTMYKSFKFSTSSKTGKKPSPRHMPSIETLKIQDASIPFLRPTIHTVIRKQHTCFTHGTSSYPTLGR